MKSYKDLIEQSFYFPTKEFKVKDNKLWFHEVNLMEIVKEYGTPLKLTYLPKISENIRYAKKIFNEAIKKHKYEGSYTYCYCTKSSHFQFTLEEILKNDVHLETSSAYDIPIIRNLQASGLFEKDRMVVCNGYKTPLYRKYVSELINDGFKNTIPVLDNLNEIDFYQEHIKEGYNVGIRVATDEEPNFAFYTSRLGIRYKDIVPLYKETISRTRAKLKMLHYFINTGIKDSAYYWSELSRFIHKYCELKKECPELDTVDIGGGFPIKNSLHHEYDYVYMADQIVSNIQWACQKNQVPVPNIVTEFGSFTVGESGATIYSVLDQKRQNDKEIWYMMDGSFVTQLPDVWGLNHKFILLPINFWNNMFHKVNIGGLTCDSMDYYDSEAHIGEVFLPAAKNKETLYFGFFHTGAYQESLGGFGGIQHCLVPAPKHVVVNKDMNGQIASHLFATEQKSDQMMKILGYSNS